MYQYVINLVRGDFHGICSTAEMQTKNFEGGSRAPLEPPKLLVQGKIKQICQNKNLGYPGLGICTNNLIIALLVIWHTFVSFVTSLYLSFRDRPVW